MDMLLSTTSHITVSAAFPTVEGLETLGISHTNKYFLP